MENFIDSIITQVSIAQGVKRADSAGLGIPFAIMPQGSVAANLEQFLPRPLIKRATPSFATRESFTRYVNEQKEPSTKIALHETRFEAVIDYHDTVVDVQGPVNNAMWCAHRASFSLVPTPEWTLWKSRSGVVMRQKEFAEFLEDNMQDVGDPAGAELLDIASTLSATIEARFKKGVRLDNSTEQIHYEEKVEAKAGVNGDMKVPRMITLHLSLFQGEPEKKINARLKYKIADGTLTFWYELVRLQDAVDSTLEEIKTMIQNETGINPFMGKL